MTEIPMEKATVMLNGMEIEMGSLIEMVTSSPIQIGLWMEKPIPRQMGFEISIPMDSETARHFQKQMDWERGFPTDFLTQILTERQKERQTYYLMDWQSGSVTETLKYSVKRMLNDLRKAIRTGSHSRLLMGSPTRSGKETEIHLPIWRVNHYLTDLERDSRTHSLKVKYSVKKKGWPSLKEIETHFPMD